MPSASSIHPDDRSDIEAERARRDVEAARYDRLPGLRALSLAEIPLTLAALQIRLPHSATDRLLDVGCGTGRFTARLAGTCGELIAVDHSRESLRILSRKLSGRADSIKLVQGDATRLPVRDRWATRVLSSQVVEHLPSERARADAVSEMARVLEPGGRAAISVYWHTPGLRWLLRRDGRHSGVIHYHRFSRSEFARLLEPHFTCERLTGRLVYLLLASTIRRT